jgi:succinate-semialdehyde dehydrogenase / glutarate-semialdehyde dehydrogenase
VFDDADLAAAVREVTACKFRNAGQTCVCTNRIYVQDGIHDAFVAAFADAVRGLRVGDPLADGTDVGPLVDAQGLAKVEAHVADAVAGARPW